MQRRWKLAFLAGLGYASQPADRVVRSLSALGHLFDLLGENPEITTIFCQQSVDISPENGLFRHRLGSLYLKRNQLEDALVQFEKAHSLGYNSRDAIKKIKKLMKEAE